MKIPFRMKSEECTTVASRVAVGSKILESCGCKSKDVKKLCRAAKDSAKKFDKTFCKLMKNVKKRNKEFKWSETDYKDISKVSKEIGEIYKDKFEPNEQAEYEKARKDMEKDYDTMISKVQSISNNDNTVKEILKSENKKLVGKVLALLNPDELFL